MSRLIPWEDENSLTSLINNVFSDLQQLAHDRDYIVQRALISQTNHFVDEVNDRVVQPFPGEEITYYSYDSIENNINGLYQSHFLNSISPCGLPLHKLTLKLGSPIILIRNLSPKTGLCNGTRLLCIGFYENFIHVEIVNVSSSGSKIFLPRIPLTSSEDSRFRLFL
ncbi:hypothetical protein AQUCO_00800035v1 [Aquilegia coerulea]|uniref:DNA helicase Pif1-like 2B domain-containing protein n=1 Tax=Aquilegia coerulea TaxID=218851 RepID=A0A2G5EH53_AQUCA|nr:hypothetical protein AQUCO_00800035v1 [Aquilegia coerulea]